MDTPSDGTQTGMGSGRKAKSEYMCSQTNIRSQIYTYMIGMLRLWTLWDYFRYLSSSTVDSTVPYTL